MIYRFADNELDTAHLTLSRTGQPVAVEPQVFDLIRLLVENPDRVVTRDEMIQAVWQGRIVSESAISARIAAARKALGDDGKAQRVIRTVARRGLQMAAPVETRAAPAPAQADMAQQRIRYTQSDRGGSLAYAVSGRGPPLPVIGTGAADIEAEWQVPVLRGLYSAIHPQRTVVRHNQMGFGLSDRSAIAASFDEGADDLRAVADAAGVDRFALMGLSGGSLTAIHCAAKYPGRVTRLVIAGGYAEGRMRRSADPAPDALKSMIAAGWRDADSGFSTGFMATYFPETPIEILHDIARLMQNSVSVESFLAERDIINAASVVDILPRVACPTLIVHGRGDAVHPLAQAQKLAAGIPDAELVVLETANHFPLPGHPTWDTYLTALLDFLGPEV